MVRDMRWVARDRVGLYIASLLAEIAADRGCAPEDLSVKLTAYVENMALACFREGYDHAHDEPTQRISTLPYMKAGKGSPTEGS